jgi:ribonuclease P/MRP protein subunit POP7
VQSVGAEINTSGRGGGGVGGQRGKGSRGGKTGKRKFGDDDAGGGGDNIEVLAEAVEERKVKRQRLTGPGSGVVCDGGGGGAGEEVIFTGTGRAIARVMELGSWFQQRGNVYNVRLETGTVRGIDDVLVLGKGMVEEGEQKDEEGGEKMVIDDEDGHGEEEEEGGGVVIERDAGKERGEKVQDGAGQDNTGDRHLQKTAKKAKEKDKDQPQETTSKVMTEEFSRIRQMSVLKVFVSLR